MRYLSKDEIERVVKLPTGGILYIAKGETFEEAIERLKSNYAENKYNIANDDKFKKVKRLNPNDYTGYAQMLASKHKIGNKQGLYEFTVGKNKAFVSMYDSDKIVHINEIGSTGGRVGSEVLLRVMHHASVSNKTLTWNAENKDSISYYSHIGLDKYAHNASDIVPQAGKMYAIPGKDIAKELKRLRGI